MNWLSLLNPIELCKVLWRWFQRPRAVILFEYELGFPENDYCHYRVDVNTHRNCLFFRLGVNNLGKTRLEEADIRVEKIEIIDRDGNRQKVRSSPFFLHWANENTDNSRLVYPNTPVFVDLVYTDSGRHGMAFFFLKTKHINTGIKEFLTPGKYIISVKLLAKDIKPLEKEICVAFDGKWDKIVLELL